MSENRAKVVAPVVAPRDTEEKGWTYLQRQREAWRAVPGYQQFIQELANGIEVACVAFVRAGNELHGVSDVQGYTYTSVEVEVDGVWKTVRARKPIAGKPKRNFRHVVAAIDYALKTEAQRKKAVSSQLRHPA